jgi:two-component system chemotaxis response regulator CheY
MNNILIVDDSPTMRRMVKASLRGLPDVSFGEASSGLEAVERLALAPVDLMILDLNMPDMHGLEVLEFLRSHQAYRHVRVIVLTTRGDEASRADALAAGASLYLTKPFAPQSLAAQALALLSSQTERA